MADAKFFYGLGRRKSATARVRLSSGKGNIIVNNRPLADYLSASQSLQAETVSPFTVLELNPGKYDVSAVVAGGGSSSQVDAVKLGIAKALCAINEDFRPTLKRADLLGRDPRERERKKAGLKSARKKRQFTKR